jgi:hypothetical protein
VHNNKTLFVHDISLDDQNIACRNGATFNLPTRSDRVACDTSDNPQVLPSVFRGGHFFKYHNKYCNIVNTAGRLCRCFQSFR